METPVLQPASYHNLLVPLDGSERAEAALPHAAALAQRFEARVILFRAVSLPPVAAAVPLAPGQSSPAAIVETVELAQEVQEASIQYLEGLARRLRAHNIGADVRVGDDTGDVAESILAAAESEGADLIVMTTHGRTGLSRLLFGSVAESVLRTARVPVLLICTRQAPEGAGP